MILETAGSKSLTASSHLVLCNQVAHARDHNLGQEPIQEPMPVNRYNHGWGRASAQGFCGRLCSMEGAAIEAVEQRKPIERPSVRSFVRSFIPHPSIHSFIHSFHASMMLGNIDVGF